MATILRPELAAVRNRLLRRHALGRDRGSQERYYLAGPATQLREAGIAVQTEVWPSLVAEQIIAVPAGEQAATTQELVGLAEQLNQHILAA